MPRPVVLLLALLAFGLTFSSTAEATTVRSFKNLTATERVEIQQSEHRLATFDLTLRALDKARQQKKISRQEYTYEYRDLTAFIAAEAKYQNDILTKDSGFAEDAREVMENIAKYAILVPAYILAAAAGGMHGASYEFSP